MTKHKFATVRTSLGDTLEVLDSDWITYEIRTYGIYGYEKKELQAFSQVFNLMPRRQVCLDVGANIGNHTGFFARHFQHVYALDPNPLVFGLLSRNIANNRWRATSFNIGLSDQNTVLDFYVGDETNLGSSSFEKGFSYNQGRTADKISAEVKLGDDFVNSQGIDKIDFIKIDVEGHEAKTIKGLRETIKKHRPFISLEWNNDITREEFAKDNLFSTILSGYSPVAFANLWNRQYWQGRLFRRRILKICALYKERMRFLDFYDDADYDVVFLVPAEHAQILQKLKAMKTIDMCMENT